MNFGCHAAGDWETGVTAVVVASGLRRPSGGVREISAPHREDKTDVASGPDEAVDRLLERFGQVTF